MAAPLKPRSYRHPQTAAPSPAYTILSRRWEHELSALQTTPPHHHHQPHPTPLSSSLKATGAVAPAVKLEFFIPTGPIAFFIVLLHGDFSPGC